MGRTHHVPPRSAGSDSGGPDRGTGPPQRSDPKSGAATASSRGSTSASSDRLGGRSQGRRRRRLNGLPGNGTRYEAGAFQRRRSTLSPVVTAISALLKGYRMVSSLW